MTWLDNVKASANAFKEWGRALTIIGAVVAGALYIDRVWMAFYAVGILLPVASVG